MDKTKQVRATSFVGGIIMLSVAIGGGIASIIGICHFSNLVSDLFYLFLIPVWIAVACGAFHYLTHPVYLSEAGVECHRFTKVQRKILWCQIIQISITRYEKFSLNTSSPPCIIITPQGCPKYSKEKSGLRYTLTFRRYAVRIDYSNRNLDFIKRHYKNVEDYT